MFARWLLLALAAQPWPAATSTVLFDGRSFDQWVVEQVDTDGERTLLRDLPEVIGGAAQITRSRGWIRTKAPYANFRLSLGYRRRADARASLYFRTWPRVDESGLPVNGYEVSLGDDRETRTSGRILSYGHSGREVLDATASKAIGAAAGVWHRLVLECRGDSAEVTIDDRVITVLTGLANPTGYIGLRGDHGVVEVRDVSVTQLGQGRSVRLTGERTGPASGVTPPKLVQDTKPGYTPSAMRERIAGSVWVEAVVQSDGSVGEVEVVRSLDPHHGLDDEAVRALRQWRFEPGLKNGAPVPVIVTVEMTFTLR